MQNIFSNLCFNMSNDFEGHIKHNRNIYISGVFSALMLSLIVFFAAFPIINKTTEAEAIAGAAKASDTTLTMTSGSESASLNLTPAGSSNGVFASSSNSQTAKFGVVTNNHTGYTLSISALNNNGELTNSEANAVLNSITNPTDADVFNTSTALNGKWGYKPSKYNGAANTNFLPSPTTTATTLDVTGSANNESNDYTIGLGARVDHTKPAGTYTSTFVLTAIGNPVTYSITYADNTGDSTVANLPTFGSDPTNHTQTGSISATSINLSSTIPTRTNYNFKSWCLGAVSNNGTTCTGTEYNAGASFNIDQTTANTSTIYAVWKLKTFDITIKTSTGISKVTLNGTECTSTSGCKITGLVYGRSYSLEASLASGYDFSGWNESPSSIGSFGNSANATTTYTVGAGNATITPTARVKTHSVTINMNEKIYQVTFGDNKCRDSSGCTINNLTAGQSYTLSITLNSKYKFINWGSSGGGTIANTTSSSTTYTVGDNDGVITPNVEFNAYDVTIYLKDGISSATLSPANAYDADVPTLTATSDGQKIKMVYGVKYVGTAYAQSGYEIWRWSVSDLDKIAQYLNNDTYSFYLKAQSNSESITAYGQRAACGSITGYMQNYSTPSNPCTTGTLTDSRDNQQYTVAIINSRLWMTKNLAIGCSGGSRSSVTLTSSNSNVASNWSTSNAGSLKNASYADTGDPSIALMECYGGPASHGFGAWYNYKAATAGTISGSSNSTKATYSICPAGWRLPTSAEFQSAVSSGYFITGAGVYIRGSLSSGGSVYWTSEASDASYRYTMGIYSNGNFNIGEPRHNGMSVRCIRS